MKGLENLSDVERLKILKSIRIASSSEEEFDEYISLYSGSMGEDECRRRLNGYFLEDEFALLCFLMGSCTSLVPLGQSSVNNPELKIPDYMASFKLPKGKEFKCFVEVKTSNSIETKKISNTMFENYLNFAHKFNLPLLFASRIQQNNLLFWIIQTVDEFIDNGRKAKIDYLTKTSGSVLLNDCFLSLITPLKLEIQFTDEPINSGMWYPNYGYVSEIKISQLDSSGNEKISLKLEKNELIFDALLNCYQCENIKNDKALILEKIIPALSSELVSSLLLKMNYIVDQGDGRMNASRLLAKMENGEKPLINNTFLFNLFTAINKKFNEAGGCDVLGVLTLGDDHTAKRNLKKLMQLNKK
ncbi:hypothetical protein J3U57_01290 [Gilliamella sp. B3464]|uniref:hypothetical protein n=1 Tax=unclassified Gilliamella TaxID=2685620 RepID=UPI00226A4BBB|nr:MULTISPECIES: hypothetical protein [unclassified Gilliamella]MCX8711153.1 hypothetical protein [Gilliamella sp. B3468]MCX8750203.1 hypothetical protein [Gilliamella sp. B3464]